MGWTAAPAAKGRSRPPMTPLLGPRPAPRLPRRCATSLVLLTFAILSCYASAACAGEACRLPGVPIVARVGLGAESCAAAGASRRVRSGGSGDPASSSSEDVVPFRRLVDASPAPVPSPTAASTPAPSPTLLPSAASPTPTTPPDCPMVVAYTAFDKIDSTQNVLPDSEMVTAWRGAVGCHSRRTAMRVAGDPSIARLPCRSSACWQSLTSGPRTRPCFTAGDYPGCFRRVSGQ